MKLLIPFQYIPPYFNMTNYGKGQMLITIKVQDTFEVAITQNGTTNVLKSEVPTVNSTHVRKIRLEKRYSDTFKWENSTSVIGTLRKDTCSI